VVSGTVVHCRFFVAVWSIFAIFIGNISIFFWAISGQLHYGTWFTEEKTRVIYLCRLLIIFISPHSGSMYSIRLTQPDRQWRSSSFQESKKVRVSHDLWPWPWPRAHPGCMLTWSPSCASLVAIRPFAWEKKRFVQKFTDGQTDGRTDRRRTPRHCINSFLEWAKNKIM